MSGASTNIEQLLENNGWLKGLAFSLVRDDALADDVVQETWLAALKDSSTHARTARSWLARVVRNLAIRTCRDQKRRIRREFAAARKENTSCTPEQLLQRAELQRDIAEAIVALKEPYRSTILLRFFEELSVREISLKEDTPITTVKSRLAKGLQQLRMRLDRRYGGDHRAWCSILIPFAGLPALVSSATESAVAGGMGSSAIGTAVSARTLVSVCWLTLKGAVMTSKAVLVATSIALSSLALWIVYRHGTELPSPANTPEQAVSLQDYQNLQSRHEENLARLKTTEETLGRYRSRNQELEQEVISGVQSLTAPGDLSAEAAEQKADEEGPAEVDWSALAKLVGENIGDAAEALRLHREGMPIPKELKGKLGLFVSQLMQYGMQFRSLYDFPIHDREICIEASEVGTRTALRVRNSESRTEASTPRDFTLSDPTRKVDNMNRRLWIPLVLATCFSCVAVATPRTIFEDSFDGKLGDGWTWLRENPSAWRLRDGALEIRVEPGVAHNVKNALVRAAPDRMKSRYAIDVTVTNTVLPTQQYEQAGITWYNGGRPIFKIVKERIDGRLYIIPGKIPMDSRSVRLRLEVSPDGYHAQFRPDGKGEFRTAAKGKFPAPKDDQVSIQCYNGPPDAEHWIRFDDFRILDLDAPDAPATPAAADDLPFLHPLFSDDMVLQRDVPAPIWGWAAPGSEVTVRVDGKSASGRADSSGRWLVKIGPLPAGGPHQLEVNSATNVTLKNVLVGDVWICSGQSNMEWSVAASNRSQEEIAAADYPRVRLFSVPKKIALTPEKLVPSRWVPCSPQTIPGFSAVGYYFGRELHRALDVPIGLIHTSWGGTVAEAWTSAEALRTMDDFRPAVDQFLELVEAQSGGQERFEQQVRAWWQKNDPGSAEGASWASASHDTSDWKSMQLPINWEAGGLGNYDGIAWFRREVELPASWAGKAAVLALGPIDDRDTTFVNGVQVGEGDNWSAPRSYRIPQGVLDAGRNVIAVRVLDTGGNGGIVGNPGQFSLKLAAGGSDAIAIAGAWHYRASKPLSEVSPAPRRPGASPNVVTVLYNGMIAPIVPYAIRGAIWYQGESNAGRAAQYRRLLPTLIRDWRSRFRVGDFPFLVVQLANFMAPQTQPAEGGWAFLREAQFLTAQADPKVGLAVAIDIGEARDIHPRNKQDVGCRLALSALEIEYGRDVVGSGPEYTAMEVRGSEIHLHFGHVGGGLIARGGDKLRGFAIAGADGKFVWGDAVIRGDTVVVSSAQVPQPKAVRYGWANNPECNLYNKEGLPASSFRTDVDAP